VCPLNNLEGNSSEALYCKEEEYEIVAGGEQRNAGNHTGTPKDSTVGANFSSVFLLLMVMVLLLPACGVLDSFACTPQERAVFAEFPQYGGLHPEPTSSNIGTCVTSYDTPAAPEQVFTYYKDQLTAHGWTVDPGLTEFDSSGKYGGFDHEGRHVGGMLIMAHRDGFMYEFNYDKLEHHPVHPRPGISLLVHVGKCENAEACR
jgi:hypothetical protein